jgi:glycerol-3-phosphate acyltransferase PlsY
MEFILFGLIAYLLGSIPTSVWVGKAKYNVDVREHGSNNAGATNTFRVLGKKAGTFVLVVDICKGALAVLMPFLLGIAEWKSDQLIHLQLVTGIMAVLGHIFPLFARFNGGKGVATSLGVIIGIHPPAALICMVVFLLFFILSSFVSLGAILGAISFPLSINLIFMNDNLSLMIFSILLAGAVVLAHHKNIKRIIHGNENKMNLFKK